MRTLTLIFALMFASALAFGQGACIQSQAITSRAGFSELAAVVPGATITASPGPLYTNQTASVQVPGINFVTVDTNGNYSLCALPGTQSITVVGPNLQTLTFLLTFAIQAASNTTWTGTDIFNGPVTFNSNPVFTGTPTFTAFNANSITTPLVQSPTGLPLTLMAANNNCFACLPGNGEPVIIQSGNASNIGGFGGSIELNAGISSATNLPAQGAIITNSTFGSYDSIPTVGNGVSPEFAQVDNTAIGGAISVTSLYTVPTLLPNGFPGAGQYRVSWNAKVTQAATTSSTLGALSITYTDPDGTVITVTAPATITAGTIATTSTGNTLSTVLVGLPLTLNCKSGTLINYAFGYVSSGATPMQYNLHIKLEAM